MLDFNTNKINCTGCAACYSACPVHCITMVPDKEGFLYPEASDVCIHCGLCKKVCPSFIAKQSSKVEQKAFAAVSKDYETWKRSASGGAFSEICRQWADDETLIVGAAWDGMKVHHIGVRGFRQIAPLCKSKYVSSAIEETFIEIKETLKEGKKAIFCGTPCQVSGLQAFLRKDYENLLTIEFICHGVGSPTVFEACIRAINKQAHNDLKAYSFRAKRKIHETDYLSLLTFADKTIYVTRDQYIQLFLKQTCLRPSCGENCNYRGRNKRPGDFTIADFKGLTTIFPDLLGTKKNYSTIVCNSKKSMALIPLLKKHMEIREVSIEDVVRFNPLFDGHTWSSQNRNQFFLEFTKDEDRTIEKYTKAYTIAPMNIKKKVFCSLPTWMRRFILKTSSFSRI